MEDHLVLGVGEQLVPGVAAVGDLNIRTQRSGLVIDIQSDCVDLEDVPVGPHPLPRLLDGEIEVPVIVTVELLHRLRGESVQLRQQLAGSRLEIIFVPSENI